jgi:hypothetical protein
MKSPAHGSWVPVPACHPCPLTPDRGCVGVPVSNPTCTGHMFENHQIAMPHVGPAIALCKAVDEAVFTASSDQQVHRGVRLRLAASRHPRAGCHPARRAWLGQALIGMRHGSHLHRVSEPCPILGQPWLREPRTSPCNHPPHKEHTRAWSPLTDGLLH